MSDHIRAVIVRQHCGGYEESMLTSKSVPATRQAVLDYFVEAGVIRSAFPLSVEDVTLSDEVCDMRSPLWKNTRMVFIMDMPMGYVSGNLDNQLD